MHLREQTMSGTEAKTPNHLNRPPIFIMGCPRSGTTLISRILDHHTQLTVYHETYYYNIFKPVMHYYGDLSRSGNLSCFISDLRESIRLQGEIPPTLEEFKEHMETPGFSGVLESLLRIFAWRQGKQVGGDKTPGHFIYLQDILNDFPESKIVFMLRDPRDTIWSMRRTFNTQIASGIHTWNRAYQASLYPSERIFRLKYEHLASDPENTVEALCDFLGIRYEAGMLQFFESLPGQITSRAHLVKLLGPVDNSSVGKYKEMAASAVKRIEQGCREGMLALRYEFVNDPVSLRASASIPQPNLVSEAWNRLRYYGLNRERWRRGWFRWKISLKRLLRHYLFPNLSCTN